MTELVSTKTFRNLPCAHRQHRHKGSCALTHGYSRAYRFVFAAQNQDQCGFVVDFGDLDWLRDWLEMMFDHTLLLEADDPHLEKFKELEAVGACNLRIMPYGVGMEGSAQYVGEYADLNLRARTKGRAWVVSVEAFENDKNSAIWTNPDAGFKGWL
jgi:6-pyruvoyltetrahydropterin/6-carboxytetrahydropterin synthase